MHLFLSPHFDDAVLSCGGLIARLVQKGQTVTVRTVMGGSPTPGRVPDTPIIRDLHARWKAGDDPIQARIREDEAAIMGLGAQVIRMTVWLDCVYRTNTQGKALYPSEESLFGAPHPDDRAAALLPTVVLPPDENVHFLYVPLGVGNHVDHQIVRAWGVALGKQNPWVALKFYEEYPYTQDNGAIDKTLAHLSASHPPLRLEREIVPLSEMEVSAKLNAIRCYESQISTFWADAAAMETATRQAMNEAGGGQPAERYWNIVRN